tara:strand:+ start:318 stop:452 length:135 start_codon:yes stop_codon:yes gene_type:complete
MNDRITEDRDWRDGINQFRLKILEEIKQINEKIEKLKQQIKETP